MSEYQTETTAPETTTPPTSIETILDSGDSSSGERSDDRGGDFDGPSSTSVPISALRAERERRKAKDKEFEALERELQQYNDAKWGIDEESLQQDDERYEGASCDPDQDARLDRYNKSFSGFAAKHGKERVAAVDAALPRLNAEQWQQVQYLVGTAPDPAASVVEYIEKIGLVDPAFKPLSLQEVLESKGKQPSNEIDDIRQQVAGLSQREQALHVAERRAIEAAGRSEFVTDFGRQNYAELDGVVGQLIQGGHPAVAQLREIYQSSPRPAYAVAQALHEWGVWSPSEEPAQQQQQRPAPVYPSNFVNARNVTARRGPAWSGPTPLNDIFDRKRESA